MTLGEIRSRIRDLLQEDAAGAWDDADLNAWINDAVAEAAAATLCVETVAYRTTDAGVGEYDLPANVVDLPADPKIRLVTFDGRRLPRRPLDEEIDSRGPSWGEQTGAPACYYLWAGRIGLLPVPDEADVLRIWYAKLPASMSSDEAECVLPAWSHPGVVDYGAWRAFSKVGDDRAADHRGRFEAMLDRLRAATDAAGMGSLQAGGDSTGWA